jgi:hypothetical protein
MMYCIVSIHLIHFTQKHEGSLDMKIKELLCMEIAFLLLFAAKINSECKCTRPWSPEFKNWNKFCGRELGGDCILDALYNCSLGETVAKKMYECKHRVSKRKHFCSPALEATCFIESENRSLGPRCLTDRGCFPKSLMIIGMEERYGKGNHSFS